MSEPRHRKLAAIGIALLVSTGRPEVLERLPTEVFNLWLDVFGEIKELQLLREEKTWGYSNIPAVFISSHRHQQGHAVTITVKSSPLLGTIRSTGVLLPGH